MTERRTMVARLLTAIVIAAVVAACGGFAGFGDAPRPLPEPTGERRSEDLPDGQVRFWPHSAPVERGVRYRMPVYTHCGLDYLFDFDGSFWEVTERPPDGQHGLDDPQDVGVVMLTDGDTVLYESSQGAEYRLARLDGPRDTYLCD
jgi:hypothetical protein